jgi:hypothetical protein
MLKHFKLISFTTLIPIALLTGGLQKIKLTHERDVPVPSHINSIPAERDSSRTDSITMTLAPNRFQLDSVGRAKLIITNHSNQTFTFGQQSFIEYFNGDKWDRLKVYNGILIEDVLYRLKGGKAGLYNIHLQPIPYKYKTGKYRMVKRLKSELGKEISATAEFLIKQ